MNGQDSAALEFAIRRARAALHVPADIPGRAWAVAPIRTETRDFVLVVFGTPAAATAIAAVDTASGEVLESAPLPGSEPHAVMPATEAIRRAGFGAHTQARLVWAPTPASRSRFYPLWELSSGDDRAWVDSVRGVVCNTLDGTGVGGGSGGSLNPHP